MKCGKDRETQSPLLLELELTNVRIIRISAVRLQDPEMVQVMLVIHG